MRIRLTTKPGVSAQRIGQHGLWDDHLLELPKELPLRVELLDDRLDDELAAGQVGELRGRREPIQRRISLLGGRPALFDSSAEVVGDPLAGPLGKLLAHLSADRLDPSLNAHLRDPGAHRAEPDDAHLANLYGQEPERTD